MGGWDGVARGGVGEGVGGGTAGGCGEVGRGCWCGWDGMVQIDGMVCGRDAQRKYSFM